MPSGTPANTEDGDFVENGGDEVRLAMGDHVRSLCALLEVPVPESTISATISVDGLEITYNDTTSTGRHVIRTVQHRGPVLFRPLDSEFAN